MSSEILKWTKNFPWGSRQSALIILLPALLLVLVCGPACAAGDGSWQRSLLLQAPQEAGQPFASPLDLAVDLQRQRYYIIDALAAMITAFNDQGTMISRFNANGALRRPVAMVRDQGDYLWVADRGVNRLLHISLKTKLVDSLALTNLLGGFIVPDRLAIDTRNNLYVLDLLSGRVIKYNREQISVATFTTPHGGKGFIDMKLKNEEVWALDGLGRTISVFNLNGDLLRTISLPQQLKFPVSFEVDRAGALYILDRHTGEIVVCDRSGRLRYTFMTRGKHAGQLAYGSRLLFDWQGNLCVADEANGRVEVLSR